MGKRCRKSLSQLRSAGVRTLDHLKTKLDSWGVSAARRKRSNASQPDSATVNRNGKVRLARLEQRDVTMLLNELGLAEEAAHLDHPAQPARTPSGKSVDDPAIRRQTRKSQRAHALFVALQELYEIDGSDITARFATETADEFSLRALAVKSEKCAKALEVLRYQAVDKQVLAHLYKTPKGEGKDPISSGEDVEVDLFAKSGSKRKKSTNRAAKKRFLQAKATSNALPSAMETTAIQYLNVPKFQRSQSFSDMPKEKSSPPVEVESQIRRVRLRGKQPASSIFEDVHVRQRAIEKPPRSVPSFEHRIHSNSAIEVATFPAADPGNQSDLLRNWSVKALKDELRRRQPNIDLDHIYLHEELCQLLSELREKDEQEIVSKNVASVQDIVDGQRKNESLQSSAGIAVALPRDQGKNSMQELRQMPVPVLKDFLARVRPDLDQRSMLEKEELCKALMPYL